MQITQSSIVKKPITVFALIMLVLSTVLTPLAGVVSANEGDDGSGTDETNTEGTDIQSIKIEQSNTDSETGEVTYSVNLDKLDLTVGATEEGTETTVAVLGTKDGATYEAMDLTALTFTQLEVQELDGTTADLAEVSIEPTGKLVGAKAGKVEFTAVFTNTTGVEIKSQPVIITVTEQTQQGSEDGEEDGSEDGEGPTETEQVVTTIDIKGHTINEDGTTTEVVSPADVKVGDELTVGVKGSVDGVAFDKEITGTVFSSDNEEVATVTQDGLVTIVGEGTANIKAEYTVEGTTDALTANYVVVATEVEEEKEQKVYTEIAVKQYAIVGGNKQYGNGQNTIEVEEGKKVNFDVFASEDGTVFEDTVAGEFSVVDEDIATVSSEGIVTGVAQGETTLTATFKQEGQQDLTVEVAVTVNEKTEQKAFDFETATNDELLAYFCKVSNISESICEGSGKEYYMSQALEFKAESKYTYVQDGFTRNQVMFLLIAYAGFPNNYYLNPGQAEVEYLKLKEKYSEELSVESPFMGYTIAVKNYETAGICVGQSSYTNGATIYYFKNTTGVQCELEVRKTFLRSQPEVLTEPKFKDLDFNNGFFENAKGFMTPIELVDSEGKELFLGKMNRVFLDLDKIGSEPTKVTINNGNKLNPGSLYFDEKLVQGSYPLIILENDTDTVYQQEYDYNINNYKYYLKAGKKSGTMKLLKVPGGSPAEIYEVKIDSLGVSGAIEIPTEATEVEVANGTDATISKGQVVILTGSEAVDVSDPTLATIVDGQVYMHGSGVIEITDTNGDVTRVYATTSFRQGKSILRTVDVLHKGLDYKLQVKDGDTFTSTGDWRSSDESVAVVANGVVTALAEGTVVIGYYENDEVVDAIDLTVQPRDVDISVVSARVVADGLSASFIKDGGVGHKIPLRLEVVTDDGISRNRYEGIEMSAKDYEYFDLQRVADSEYPSQVVLMPIKPVPSGYVVNFKYQGFDVPYTIPGEITNEVASKVVGHITDSTLLNQLLNGSGYNTVTIGNITLTEKQLAGLNVNSMLQISSNNSAYKIKDLRGLDIVAHKITRLTFEDSMSGDLNERYMNLENIEKLSNVQVLTLYLYDKDIEDTVFSKLNTVTNFNLSGNGIKYKALGKVGELIISGNSSGIAWDLADLANEKQLQSLVFTDLKTKTQLKDIDFSGHDKLSRVSFTGGKDTQLMLPNAPNLEFISLYYNPSLTVEPVAMVMGSRVASLNDLRTTTLTSTAPAFSGAFKEIATTNKIKTILVDSVEGDEFDFTGSEKLKEVTSITFKCPYFTKFVNMDLSNASKLVTFDAYSGSLEVTDGIETITSPKLSYLHLTDNFISDFTGIDNVRIYPDANNNSMYSIAFNVGEHTVDTSKKGIKYENGTALIGNPSYQYYGSGRVGIDYSYAQMLHWGKLFNGNYYPTKGYPNSKGSRWSDFAFDFQQVDINGTVIPEEDGDFITSRNNEAGTRYNNTLNIRFNKPAEIYMQLLKRGKVVQEPVHKYLRYSDTTITKGPQLNWVTNVSQTLESTGYINISFTSNEGEKDPQGSKYAVVYEDADGVEKKLYEGKFYSRASDKNLYVENISLSIQSLPENEEVTLKVKAWDEEDTTLTDELSFKAKYVKNATQQTGGILAELEYDAVCYNSSSNKLEDCKRTQLVYTSGSVQAPLGGHIKLKSVKVYNVTTKQYDDADVSDYEFKRASTIEGSTKLNSLGAIEIIKNYTSSSDAYYIYNKVNKVNQGMIQVYPSGALTEVTHLVKDIEIKGITKDLIVGAKYRLSFEVTYVDGTTKTYNNPTFGEFNVSTSMYQSSVDANYGLYVGAQGAMSINVQHTDPTTGLTYAFTKTGYVAKAGGTLLDLHILPNPNVVKEGETVQLQVIAEYANGTKADITNGVSFVNTHPRVLSFNKLTAEVTGKTKGVGYITTQYQDMTVYSKIVVTDPDGGVLDAELQSVELLPKELNLKAGQTSQLVPMGNYDNGESKMITESVIWKVADETIATVKDGFVEALKEGSVNVIMEYAGNFASAKINVFPADASDKVIGLELVPNNVRANIGEEVQLGANALIADGTKQTLSVDDLTFTSANSAIATVDVDGVLTAKAEGTTTITVSDGTLTETVKVEVVVKEETKPGETITIPAPVETLVINAEDVELKRGDKKKLSVQYKDDDGVVHNITAGLTYSMDNPNVVKVWEADEVAIMNGARTASLTPMTFASGTTKVVWMEAIGNGTTNLVVSYRGFSETIKVTVTGMQEPEPKPPVTLSSITATPSTMNLEEGQEDFIRVTGTYSDGTKQDVTAVSTFTVSDNKIAQTQGNAVMAIKEGSTTVNISTQGKTATVNVNVTKKPQVEVTLSSITVTPSSMNLNKGDKAQITVTGIYSNGTTKDLTSSATYTSGNTSVATTEGNIVTGALEGKTVITVTQGTFTKEIPVTVNKENVIEKPIPTPTPTPVPPVIEYVPVPTPVPVPVEPEKACTADFVDTLAVNPTDEGKLTSKDGFFTINSEDLGEGTYNVKLTSKDGVYIFTVEKLNEKSGKFVRVQSFPSYLDLTVNSKCFEDKVFLKLTGKAQSAIPHKFDTDKGSVTIKLLKPESMVFFVKENPFIDLKNAKNMELIANFRSRQIVYGTTPTTFSPETKLTRAQMSAMIARALGLPDAGKADFKDMGKHWSTGYVYQLKEKGIVQGDGGNFKPNERITAKQLHSMLERTSKFVGGKVFTYEELFGSKKQGAQLTRAEATKYMTTVFDELGLLDTIGYQE